MIQENVASCIKKASNYDGVLRIGVFGSYARNEQRKDSDLDIIYDYYYYDDVNNGIDETFEFLDMLEIDLTNILGDRKIDFTSYHGLLDSDNSMLRQNVLNDVIWVYDKTQA